MKNKRRKFSAAFKAKIAVEAIKEQLTLSELYPPEQLPLPKPLEVIYGLRIGIVWQEFM